MPRPIRTNAAAIKHIGNPSPKRPRQDLGELETANPVRHVRSQIGGIAVRGDGTSWGPAVTRYCGASEHGHEGDAGQFQGKPTKENLESWSKRASNNSPRRSK